MFWFGFILVFTIKGNVVLKSWLLRSRCAYGCGLTAPGQPQTPRFSASLPAAKRISFRASPAPPSSGGPLNLGLSGSSPVSGTSGAAPRRSDSGAEKKTDFGRCQPKDRLPVPSQRPGGERGGSPAFPIREPMGNAGDPPPPLPLPAAAARGALPRGNPTAGVPRGMAWRMQLGALGKEPRGVSDPPLPTLEGMLSPGLENTICLSPSRAALGLSWGSCPHGPSPKYPSGSGCWRALGCSRATRLGREMHRQPMETACGGMMLHGQVLHLIPAWWRRGTEAPGQAHCCQALIWGSGWAPHLAGPRAGSGGWRARRGESYRDKPSPECLSSPICVSPAPKTWEARDKSPLARWVHPREQGAPSAVWGRATPFLSPASHSTTAFAWKFMFPAGFVLLKKQNYFFETQIFSRLMVFPSSGQDGNSLHYNEGFRSTLNHLKIMNPVSWFLPPKVTLVWCFASLLVINIWALEGRGWKTTHRSAAPCNLV